MNLNFLSIGDGRGKHNAVNLYEVAVYMENDTPCAVLYVQPFGLGMMAFDVGGVRHWQRVGQIGEFVYLGDHLVDIPHGMLRTADFDDVV